MALLESSFNNELVVVFSVILLLTYLFYKQRYSYWEKRGVPGPKPRLFVGNMVITNKVSLGLLAKSLYDRTKQHPFVGIYLFHRPAILVNDLTLVRHVLTKDFSYFMDRGVQFNPKTQPLTVNTFTATGNQWRGLRNKLTGVFTSNRMKHMLDLIVTCGEKMVEYIKVESLNGDDLDVKEIVARYATDAVASCAFGIESNCFKYPDAEFRVMGKGIAHFGLKKKLTMIMTLCAPSLQKIIDGKLVEKHYADYFVKIVFDTIAYREKHNIKRNDMLQMLMQMKYNDSAVNENEPDGTKLKMDDMSIAAQAFSFFQAGFEPTAITLTFALEELSKNKGIQKRLIEEIDSVLERHDGKITYDNISEMKYLTQVIEETMRIHPAVPQMLRLCTKDYPVPDTDVVIEKGTPILISLLGIQTDSSYFENPEEFNPDNFSPEKKNSRDSYTSIPFGEGPRICIGLRLSLMKIRIGLISILRNFEVHPPSDLSKNYLEYNPIFIIPKVHLKFTSRKLKRV